MSPLHLGSVRLGSALADSDLVYSLAQGPGETGQVSVQVFVLVSVQVSAIVSVPDLVRDLVPDLVLDWTLVLCWEGSYRDLRRLDLWLGSGERLAFEVVAIEVSVVAIAVFVAAIAVFVAAIAVFVVVEDIVVSMWGKNNLLIHLCAYIDIFHDLDFICDNMVYYVHMKGEILFERICLR